MKTLRGSCSFIPASGDLLFHQAPRGSCSFIKNLEGSGCFNQSAGGTLFSLESSISFIALGRELEFH
jgi:hypothetical protein